MLRRMTYEEALMVVFPLLNGRDLSSCMQVCKQWRDIAGDDYFWKALCANRWPSICKMPTPFPVSYHKLFQMFCKCHRRQDFLSPRLSFDDLEFYIDVWVEERIVFSEVIPGSVLRGGPKELPPDIYVKLLRNHLEHVDEYKLIIPVEPTLRFSIPCPETHKVSISVLIGRRDTNKVASIVNKTTLAVSSDTENFTYGLNNLNFGCSFYPFKSPVNAFVSLLNIEDLGRDDFDIFAIELAFLRNVWDSEDEEHVSVVDSEEEVLWLLSMLDWD